MRRWMKNAAFLFVCAGLLCGCTKSTVINPDPIDYSQLPQPGPDGIVWEQLWDDWHNIYEDPAAYPFVETVNASIYPDEGVARFFLLTNTDEITELEASEFAMQAVQGFGELITAQNADYAKPDLYSFGGYLEPYDIYVMVAPDDTKTDESTWIINDTIPAGEFREFYGKNGPIDNTEPRGPLPPTQGVSDGPVPGDPPEEESTEVSAATTAATAQ